MGIVVSTGASKPPLSSAEQREKRRQTRFLTGGGLILVLLGFAVLLRALAFEGVLIVSNSMQPTLSKGDYILVDHRAALRGSWARGDIIAFIAPPTWNGPGVTLVKRIIGVPGEEVGILSGRVLINNRFLPENYFAEMPIPEDVPRRQLGPQEFFVMGDNRNNSDDSRNNGPIEESDIRGRVLWRLWPRSRFARIETPDYSSVAKSKAP